MPTVVADAVTDSSLDGPDVLRRELAQAYERIGELEADNARLVGGNERLTAEVEGLRGKLEESRRAGKRQAAPFSRGTKKDKPARPGRKPGADYGPKARRLPPDPEQVDETVEVGLPECCADCGENVAFDGMRSLHDPRSDRGACRLLAP
jgi:hypothetical protein